MFLAINTQVDASSVREEELDGRKYWVAPLASLTSGVHQGNNGPLLYPEEDVSRSCPSWNNKPIVVYHPKDDSGNFISAANKRTLEKSTVGFLLNSRYESKLRHEAWIDQAKAAKVDNRVVDAIVNKTMMEVSTGLFHDLKNISGTWNSEKYDAIVCNIQPDHLALLPDEIGACSIQDGAGLLQVNTSQKSLARKIIVNETSHGQLYQDLSTSLIQKRGDNAWLYEVYDKYAIFSQDGKMYQMSYAKAKGGSLEIDLGSIQQVTEEKKYVPFQVTFNRSSQAMATRNELVTNLIANTAYGEADREWLTALDDTKFNSISVNTRKLTGNTEAPAPAPVAVATPAAPVLPVTLQGYVDAAPTPEIKAQLNEALLVMNTSRAELVTTITSNAANTLTAEVLATMPTAALKGIAAMAAATKQAPTNNGSSYNPAPNFVGQGPTTNTGGAQVTGLALPGNPFAPKA